MGHKSVSDMVIGGSSARMPPLRLLTVPGSRRDSDGKPQSLHCRKPSTATGPEPQDTAYVLSSRGTQEPVCSFASQAAQRISEITGSTLCRRTLKVVMLHS